MREEDGEAGRNTNSHGAVSSSNQQGLQQGNTRNPAIEDHYMESSGRRGGTLQCVLVLPELSSNAASGSEQGRGGGVMEGVGAAAAAAKRVEAAVEERLS